MSSVPQIFKQFVDNLLNENIPLTDQRQQDCYLTAIRRYNEFTDDPISPYPALYAACLHTLVIDLDLN